MQKASVKYQSKDTQSFTDSVYGVGGIGLIALCSVDL
jgi:hypothetical protein